MAIIPQKSLFSWNEIEALGDLERLRLVLAYLPDEVLMLVLEGERGKGRNDYPVRAVWNSLLAGVVYQHVSVESLRRELLRNGQLRDLCGFDPVQGETAVPTPSAYTHFLGGLRSHAELIDGMFDELVESLRRELPGFGRHLAGDGKAIPTHARAPKKDAPARCPARQYGYPCSAASECAARTGVRIPLELDRRVFTPMARSSYAWERTYKKRTAAERVNSRLDISYGFERHFIRGLAKMRVRCGLALVVMLATALGRVTEKRADLARSLVRAA